MMKSTKKCPLFSTISLAADGDEVAIEKILNHYDAYISKASLRPFLPLINQSMSSGASP